MYIGPWQEYRLAKIQDDAIQRLRQEWEAQLRGQVPPGDDDDRIRELMQPLVAKLPSMLLAAKSRTNGLSTKTKNGLVMGPRGSVNSEVGSRCSSRPASARSTASSASARTRTIEAEDVADGQRKPREENNQETHDENSSRAPFKPLKPKKKGKKTLTALEQVQKRKRMFATWIKQAGNDKSDASRQVMPQAKPETKEVAVDRIVTRLPPIHSALASSGVMLLSESASSKASSALLLLPPLSKPSISTDASSNEEFSRHAAVISPRVAAPSNATDIDLDESVDEEEVNNLLNWTDTLISPQAMDSLCDFD